MGINSRDRLHWSSLVRWGGLRVHRSFDDWFNGGSEGANPNSVLV